MIVKPKYQKALDHAMRGIFYDVTFERHNSTCERLQVATGILLVSNEGEPIVRRFACNGPRVPCASLEPGKCGHVHAEIRALQLLNESETYRNHKHLGVLYVYSTHAPCEPCARALLDAKVAVVVYDTAYRDPSGVNRLRSRSVQVEQRDPALGSRYIPDYCGNKRR